MSELPGRPVSVESLRELRGEGRVYSREDAKRPAYRELFLPSIFSAMFATYRVERNRFGMLRPFGAAWPPVDAVAGEIAAALRIGATLAF